MVLCRLTHGRLYRSQDDEWFSVDDEVELPQRHAERLSDRIERLYDLSQNVGPIAEEIKCGKHDDVLDEIVEEESDNKNRKTVLRAVGERRKELKE